MEILIHKPGKYEDYALLRAGDTFMLPNGDTVYMVLESMNYDRHAYRCVNLKNGNVYDNFGEKRVVKMRATLEAEEA